MSKALRIPDYLGHINKAIARIRSYVAGMDWAAFVASPLTQDATLRNLEIIGEAARKLPRADPQFSATHPDFPLGRAIGMRNTLAHGYFAVKLEILWQTIEEDLPALAAKVEKLLVRIG